MKKLIRNILLFLIPALIVITLLPVDKRLKFQGLKDDCFNHGIWIHDRININEKPIDVAFLGSSHTINGINDKIINENTNCGQVVNLGYCRLGRNLIYTLLQELVSKKDVKYLILEVRENEDRYSHPIFPYIAKSRDVLFPNPFFNRDIFIDMWTHFVYKIEIFQDMFYHQESIVPVRTDDFGFASSSNTAATTYLDEIKQKRSIPKPPLGKIEHDFHSNFSRVYLKKIGELCDENNTTIFFLYLPSYGSTLMKPNEYNTYLKYGDVLLPPKNIFENQANWSDENHLNQTGAEELSLWIAGQMNNWR